QYEAGEEGDRPGFSECRAGGREELAIRDAGWAGGFASATAKTLRDVVVNDRVVRCHHAIEQRAHDHEATARRVVLVFQGYIRGARLQAEPAVHTSVEACFRLFEW